MHGSAWLECVTCSAKLQRGGKKGITLSALFCLGLEKSSPSPASRTGPPDGWPTGPVGGGPLYSKLIDSIFKVSICQFRTHIIKIIFLQEPPEKERWKKKKIERVNFVALLARHIKETIYIYIYIINAIQ